MVAGATPTTPASATSTDHVDHVVVPTGSHPQDGQNIQVALDAGGTILLASRAADGTPTAFDLGPPDRSSTVGLVTTDVTILGETDGITTTTLRGGYIPILSVERVALHVEGIRFEAPALSAVLILASSRAVITGNEIHDVTGVPLPFGFTEGRAIKLLGNADPAGAITGSVRITDNEIHHLAADLSHAVVLDRVAASVSIEDNVISDVETGGIVVIESSGAVGISRNDIRPGPGSGGVLSFGSGIELYGSAGASYAVERNRIAIENALGDAILLAGGDLFGPAIHGASIRQNAIAVDGALGGITLLDEVHGTRVEQNRLEGTADSGIGLWATGWVPNPTALGNGISGNALQQVHAATADIVLGEHTSETVVVGGAEVVIDDGTANHVTGSVPMHGTPGRSHRRLLDHLEVIVGKPGP